MTVGTVPGYGSQQRPTNSLALAAMICSIAGIVTGITFPIGAILGHVALRQVRERGDHGEGHARTAIIVGWIGTALFIVFIVALMALFTQALGEVS